MQLCAVDDTAALGCRLQQQVLVIDRCTARQLWKLISDAEEKTGALQSTAWQTTMRQGL